LKSDGLMVKGAWISHASLSVTSWEVRTDPDPDM